jgi:hypothetical protein
MNLRRILFFGVGFLVAGAARADLCDFYRSENPELYKLVCADGHAGSKPAGANTTFSSAFNLNAASLPTEPSGYGLEVLGHRIRDGGATAPTFSLVKGFRKFGTGISTGGNNTFYGDDVIDRLSGIPELKTFAPPEPARGQIPNLNIGTSLELLSPTHGPVVRLGLSGRYNQITDTWGGGPALLLNWKRFSLGGGYSREQISNFLPRLTFVSLQATFRFWLLEFEYDRLTDNSGFGLKPIEIYTATLTIQRLILTAAVRHLDTLFLRNEIQHHYAVQFLFSKHVSAGLLYNYIPGATSIGLQYYL